MLGTFSPETDDYHRQIIRAAGAEVVFPGAIYEPEVVQAIRFHSLAYVHGHTVGGTNPSLVEAMAAGNPVVAHGNAYNRWVAGPVQRYFTDAGSLSDQLDALLENPDVLHQMHDAARARHAEEFTWEFVAGQYEAVIARLQAERATKGWKVWRRTATRVPQGAAPHRGERSSQ